MTGINNLRIFGKWALKIRVVFINIINIFVDYVGNIEIVKKNNT